jgi:hypothetical protein
VGLRILPVNKSLDYLDGVSFAGLEASTIVKNKTLVLF